MDRLTDRARNDLKSVEGPSNTNLSFLILNEIYNRGLKIMDFGKALKCLF